SSPLVRVVAAIYRHTAIIIGANGYPTCGMVADVTIHIGIHHVLSGRIESQERFDELVPVLGGIHVEKRIVQAVVESPAQSELAAFAGDQFRDDGTVARDGNVEDHIGSIFDMNDFAAMIEVAPALWRLILAFFVQCLNVQALHRGTYVGESPANSLIVADNYKRQARKTYTDDIKISAAKMDLVPEVGHLVVEVHVIRKQRLSRNGVGTGEDPVIRTRVGQREFWQSRRGGCNGSMRARSEDAVIVVRTGIVGRIGLIQARRSFAWRAVVPG